MISLQELRQAVKEMNSPPPQPEDPGRSLDPASQEDPDISVELIDGVFYQSSNDNALVAITADYPRLVPASQVTETEVSVLKKGSVLVLLFLLPYNSRVLQGRSSGQRVEPVATSQQGAARRGRRKRPTVRIETPAQRYGASSLLQDIILRGILTPMPSFQEKERLPDYTRRGY